MCSSSPCALVALPLARVLLLLTCPYVSLSVVVQFLHLLSGVSLAPCWQHTNFSISYFTFTLNSLLSRHCFPLYCFFTSTSLGVYRICHARGDHRGRGDPRKPRLLLSPVCDGRDSMGGKGVVGVTITDTKAFPLRQNFLNNASAKAFPWCRCFFFFLCVTIQSHIVCVSQMSAVIPVKYLCGPCQMYGGQSHIVCARQ